MATNSIGNIWLTALTLRNKTNRFHVRMVALYYALYTGIDIDIFFVIKLIIMCKITKFNFGFIEMLYRYILFGVLGIITYPCGMKGRSQLMYKQGKSEGFDSCYWPSNLKLDSNRQFFRPCDREIWWITSKNNRALLLYYVKLFKSIGEFKLDLQSRNAQFGSELVICYPVWPYNFMNDLGKQQGTSSMLLQGLCSIS